MTFMLSNPYGGLRRCPQCGIASPTLSLEHVLYSLKREKIHREVGQGQHIPGWGVFRCTTCDEVVCIKGAYPYFTDATARLAGVNGHGAQGYQVLPEIGADLSDIPTRAATYLRQASESLSAPDGAVMLAGSAVDAMLKAKGLAGGSVFDRINAAVAGHLLTPEMGEWAHAVRISSNNPRHADEDDPHATAEDAKKVIEFAEALAQFLFVLPARVARGKQAAEAAAN
jgi:hypothetical protein